MSLRRCFATLLIGAIGFGAVGCGTSEEEKAIIRDKTPVKELFERGEKQLDQGAPDEAAKAFDDVERLYPYSQWAKRAMIMSAYSYYQADEYDEAALAAHRYLSFFPSDKDAAYAQYLIGLSYYDQIVDVGRDQALTRKAMQGLRDTVQRYPDSEYTRDAQFKLDLTIDHLAGKEMEIGRYYLKRHQYVGAINRFRTVVEQYQTTTHVEEALHRLVECYLALGVTDEAQTAAAVLGHNFPGSPWYFDSYALLTGRHLKPENRGDSWLSEVYRRVIKGEWL